MSSRARLIGLVTLLAAFFYVWHSALLTDAAAIRGFNSDSAILALMGKKMLEGRGFDIFFWGQNYVGPLTSMFVALAGLVTGGVDPLALRIGAMTEVFVGLLLTGWAVSFIDRRAALVTMAALAVTPPVALRMMIMPLGAEMGFVMAAVVVGLYLRKSDPLLLGLAAGVAWWMNQQILFTLMAIGAVTAFRYRHLVRVELRRPIPGLLQALVFVLMTMGAVVFVIFVVRDAAGIEILPFILGPATDALLLLLVPPAVTALFYLRVQVPLGELVPLGRVAAGALAGYTPVWLGRLLGWYEPTYVFGFRLNDPSEAVAGIVAFGELASHWMGANVIAFCLFLAAGFWYARSAPRVLLALIVLANAAFCILAGPSRPHYLISSVGMLFAVAALGAVDLWQRRRRIVVAAGAVVVFVTLGLSAKKMHADVLAEPDPRPLLASVRANDCAVTYADFWTAYRYRLLDEERGAWIPYRSQNRTRTESARMQQLPGQRCLVGDDGTVTRIAADLPLTHTLPHAGATPTAHPQ